MSYSRLKKLLSRDDKNCILRYVIGFEYLCNSSSKIQHFIKLGKKGKMVLIKKKVIKLVRSGTYCTLEINIFTNFD